MSASTQPDKNLLDGVRVLELGTTIAGPFCARLLADFGAEVVKVEPLEGDPIRTTGKRFKDKPLYAASIMRNKQLVAIDLRTPEGQDLVRTLVAKSDILVENFRPGTMEKWGLGYDALAKINPGLIMVRISGYGQTGPYSKRPGYGVVCEAVGGLRYINGDPDRPPARSNIALTDCITGVYAAFGTVMALRYREKTGIGQVVDTALYECAFSFMEAHIPAYEKLGYVVQREGSAHGNSVVNNLFITREGEYIHIQGSQANGFRRLCLAIGRPDILEDARFNTRLERGRHGEEIDGIVGEWVAARDYEDVAQALGAGDVVFTRIYSMADIFKDPHYKARGMLAQVPDEDIGSITVAAPVPRLSKTPGSISHSGGGVGRDTREVLKKVAGLSDEVIERLEAQKIIFSAPAAVNYAGRGDAAMRILATGFIAAISAVGIVVRAIPAHAQVPAWKPDRNVEIVVSAGPSGNQDLTARMIQGIWQEKKIVPSSIVVNKPGGGGAIAYTYVSQRARDPHLLVMLAPTLFTSRIMGQIKFQHTDFTPIATLFEEYIFVSVRADSPIKTGKDLITRLKASPDSLSIAIAATIGNHVHVGLALPMKAADVNIGKMLVVAYKSSGESFNALLGGHIDVAASTFGTVLPHLEARRVRVIGMSAPRRMTGLLATVPTWREQGADAVFSSWRGIAAAKGITEAQVKYWETALAAMANTEEWKKDVERNFRVPQFLNGRESGKYWDAQYSEVETAMMELGLKALNQ